MFWENIFYTSIVFIVFVVIIIAIYSFVSSRGMKKQKAHFEELHKALKVGQRVQFASGIYGTLKRVGEETVDIEVKNGAVLEVSRYAISEIVK